MKNDNLKVIWILIFLGQNLGGLVLVMVMLQSFIQYLLYLVEKVGNNLKYAVLKGQSHEIKVRFFGAQWIEKILLIFPRKGFSSFY